MNVSDNLITLSSWWFNLVEMFRKSYFEVLTAYDLHDELHDKW
jgi:hypothetical protein